MDCLPIVSGYHFDRVPGTTVEERTIGTFADALLTTNAQIRIDLDSSERWVVLVRYPEHACFDRTIFDARRRTRAASATVCSYRQNARTLLSCRLAVAL